MVPSGIKLMAHRHPEDRVYTVISGVFYIRSCDSTRSTTRGTAEDVIGH
jgi:hypothetical protein